MSTEHPGGLRAAPHTSGASRRPLLLVAIGDPVLLGLIVGLGAAACWLAVGPAVSWQTTFFWAVQAPADLVFCLSARQVARQVGTDAPGRRFWRLCTFAAAMFVAGDLLRTAEGLVGIEHNDPGLVQTFCFVVGQVAFLWALAGYPILIGTGAARQRFVLDAAVVVCGSGAVVWFLLTSSHGSGTTDGSVVGGVFVGASVLIVGYLTIKLVLSGGGPFTRPAAVALIATAIGQALAAGVLPIYARRVDLGVSLAIQLIPSLLIAAGPRLQLLQLRINPVGPAEDRRRAHSLLPYGAVVVVHGLLLFALVTHPVLDLRAWGLLVAVSMTTGLVVCRQLLSVADNSRLITRLDRSVLELHEQRNRFSSLVAHSSDITLVVDRSGAISYASPAAEQVLGLRPDQLVGTRFGEHLVVEDWAGIRAEVAALWASPGRAWTVQLRLRSADRGWRWLETFNTNLLDDPAVCGIVCNGRDVTDARELQDQLRYQASHDVLTQLPNRRLFTERLEAAAAGLSAGPASGPIAEQVALLMIDLDGFKSINDTHGHHVGDEVLIAVADRIGRCVRPTDTAARLGGDEFAVLLPGATTEEARRIAERFLSVLAEPVAIGDLSLVVRASVGVTIGAAADPAALLRRADAAMYDIKRGVTASALSGA